MSILNKVLLGLLGVAALALFYLAARTLKTHQHWREIAQRLEAKIDQVQKDTYKLREGVAADGTPAPAGVRQVRRDLHQLLVDRGRVWPHCVAKVGKPDNAKGLVDVSITAEASDPNSLANKGNMVVYAFAEAGAQEKPPGEYLGEFRVTVGPDKQPLLQSATMMTPRELERLSKTKGPWILYEQMPRDKRSSFADLTDEQKNALLPAESVADYVKDGKPAAPDDPAERTKGAKYERSLRDYRTLFHADRGDWRRNLDNVRATTQDREMIESALADAKRQLTADEKHVVEAKEKLTKYERERDIVKAHHEKLQVQLEAVRAEIANLLKANQAKADELARSQLDAKERIDRRVHSMVQSNVEGR
jgi:hypothetical protein